MSQQGFYLFVFIWKYRFFSRKFFSDVKKETISEKEPEEKKKDEDSQKKTKVRKINPRDKEFIDFIANQIKCGNSKPSSYNNTPEKK